LSLPSLCMMVKAQQTLRLVRVNAIRLPPATQ
jgi:hypothetical protein